MVILLKKRLKSRKFRLCVMNSRYLAPPTPFCREIFVTNSEIKIGNPRTFIRVERKHLTTQLISLQIDAKFVIFASFV